MPYETMGAAAEQQVRRIQVVPFGLLLLPPHDFATVTSHICPISSAYCTVCGDVTKGLRMLLHGFRRPHNSPVSK